MKKRKKKNPHIFFGFSITVIVLLSLNLFLFYGLNSFQRASLSRELAFSSRLEAQEKLVENINHSVALLVDENSVVASKLEEEREKRSKDTEQIAALQKELEANESAEASSIVQSWSRRVARLSCLIPTDNPNIEIGTKGSAVLFSNINGGPGVVTNRHVLEEDGFLASDCDIEFSDSEIEYDVDPSEITLSHNEDEDWAKIRIRETDSELFSRLSSGSSLCIQNPGIGEEVIILGYPRVGSKESITATEGIISGLEKDFYITSAKVERGNSGGAAILAKENCYLGTPTFTSQGQVESLARVLRQDIIF